MAPCVPPRLTLVTGPARSGKSEWAEALAAAGGRPVTYVATSAIDPTDLDWQARIEGHRRRRPADWVLREVPHALDRVILDATPDDCLLIDSLGTWLANHLDLDDAAWRDRQGALLDACDRAAASLIFVAEETGWGVVPAYPIGRQFRDRLGYCTRALALQADAAYLLCAGHAIDLKRWGVPLGAIAAASPP